MPFAALLAAADGAAQSLLGGAVVYRPFGGDPVTVTGVFERYYQRAEPDARAGYTAGPAVWLREADLVDAAGVALDADEDGALVTYADAEYRVRSRERDGQGGLLLHLHAVEAE